MTSRKTSKAASVQAAFVPVRDVVDDILCLDAPSAPGRREYRAVLEISGLNYSLKSESEQRGINDVFRLILAGLSHSLQVLVRVLPLDIEKHLRQLHLDRRHPIFLEPSMQEYLRRWCEVSDSYVQWWQTFAQSRLLLERHFYIVVPADSLFQKAGGPLSLVSGVGGLRASDAFDRARQQLLLRCSEIMRQLSGLGLEVRRLNKEELINLEYETLTPQRARTSPLQDGYIDGLGHLVQRSDQACNVARTHAPASHTGMPVTRPGKNKGRSAEDVLGWPNLVDLLAPGGIQVSSDALYVESEHNRIFALRGLPRYVPPGWLNPLLVECDEPMDIVFFFDPRENGAMIQTYQRRLYEMESSEILDRDKGRKDHDRNVVHADVEDLIGRLASGEERMVDVSMYIRLRGATKRELNTRSERIQSICNSMLLHMRPCLFEQDKGLRTCLPHGRNELRSTDNGVFTLPATVASTFFMFLSNSLTEQDGILEGITDGQEPLLFDRWGSKWRNAHRLILGPSGVGKSMKLKEDVARLDMLYNHPLRLMPRRGATVIQIGLQQIIVDPEREFLELCQQRGGQWIRIAPGSQHHINILDMPQRYDPDQSDVLADQIQFTLGALELMLGGLTGSEKALADAALYSCYKRRGITSDPATHRRQAPLLSELHWALEQQICGPDTTNMAQRLRRFVSGSLAGIFAGQTNVSLTAPIVVLDTYDLKPDLRPVATYLITHLLWAMSFESDIPRHFVLDELLTLYRYAEGQKMIEEIFQRGRKRGISVSAVVQHPGPIKDSTIVANCQMLIIMAQEPSSIDAVAEFAHLSPPEVALVRKCRKGDGVIVIGDKRFFVHFPPTDAEYRMATTDQRDRARYRQEASDAQQDRGAPLPEPPAAFHQFVEQPTGVMLPVEEQPTADMPPVQGVKREDTSTTDKLTPLARTALGSRSRPLEVA